MLEPGIWIQFAVLLLLLAASGFFSSAETALNSVNRVRVGLLAEEGDARAVLLQKILGNYANTISAILVGNNIVNLTASALTTKLVIGIWGNRYVGLATGILTAVILLSGEIVPKHWAAANAEKVSLRYAGLIRFFTIVLTPVIVVVDWLSAGILKLLRVDMDKKDVITEGELRTYVQEGLEEGVLENDEHKIITSVFDFSNAEAHDIMIPRSEMVTVDVNAGYTEIKELFRENMYTRLPVYEGDRNNIIGLINIKDFLFVDDPASFEVRQILRDVYYTYETQESSELLRQMQKATTSNMAIVIDEYGMTVGMITTEDLLEELVGEIRDEYDADELAEIQKTGDRTWLVDGSTRLTDLNDVLGTDLTSEHFESLGGVILEKLDRVPREGESVTLDNGITLTVVRLVKRRIERVRLTLPAPEKPAQTN